MPAPEPLRHVRIPRRRLDIEPAGGRVEVDVSCPLGCVSTAHSGVAWLRVVRIEASENGRARATLDVDANETPAPRVATWKLLGTLVSVVQRTNSE